MSEAPPPTDVSSLNHHNKRKRSPPPLPPSAAPSAPPSKAPKTAPAATTTPSTTSSNSQLQINYIARQCIDDLPFVSKDDTLLGLLDILSAYSQVLDRHESLASNLGARPLGPILIKRFERCFDGAPRVIASHSHARDQDLPQVTWLDVVHFAQAHASQFTLSTFSEGRRVCQFYYPQKQVRVQISEEDFLFISSGRCQDLIPPLPIWEDEEKEVATCEFVEKALRDLTAAADSVAARTRQLAHRLKGRRMAIQERRAVEDEHTLHSQLQPQPQSHAHAGAGPVTAHPPTQPPERPDPGTNIRQELLKHFQSLPPKHADNRRLSVVQQQQQPASPPRSSHYHTPPPLPQQSAAQAASSSVSPVPTAAAAVAAAAAAAAANHHHYQLYPNQSGQYAESNAESPKDGHRHNFSRPLLPSQEVSQPYRALCQAYMESLPRSSRVMPPCDRCRRLKMDCLKNLSSCAGCTKKHARCHWKDVGRQEVQGLEGFEDAERVAAEFGSRLGHDYETSDTSVDGDATRRQSAEYEAGNASASHQHPGPTHHYQRPFEEPVTQGDRPSTHRPQPFPDEHAQHLHSHTHTMDLMRLLANEPPRDSAFPGSASPARNNGAFKTYTPHPDQRLGEGPSANLSIPVSNGMNNRVSEGERA